MGFAVRAAIRDMNGLLSSITAGLDAVQSASSGNTAAAQYFSNGSNFAALVRLVGLAIAYLLQQIFDLKVAKRFTLTRPRAPVEITVREYGELGPDDSYLDLFIASNHLRGDEILLLPRAGGGPLKQRVVLEHHLAPENAP